TTPAEPCLSGFRIPSTGSGQQIDVLPTVQLRTTCSGAALLFPLRFPANNRFAIGAKRRRFERSGVGRTNLTRKEAHSYRSFADVDWRPAVPHRGSADCDEKRSRFHVCPGVDGVLSWPDSDALCDCQAAALVAGNCRERNVA